MSTKFVTVSDNAVLKDPASIGYPENCVYHVQESSKLGWVTKTYMYAMVDGNPESIAANLIIPFDRCQRATKEDMLHAEHPCIVYDPITHGTIDRIRIYLENGVDTMAELAFASGGGALVVWDRPKARNAFLPGINAYTLFYDERIDLRMNPFGR